MTKPDTAATLEDSPVLRANGTHCIGNLLSQRIDLLSDFIEFKKFIEREITSHNLVKIGEVYHNFFEGGFTAVICLSESHLSIHTWPERGYLTFDVFLSNFKKDNSEITSALYKDTISFFEATVKDETILSR